MAGKTILVLSPPQQKLSIHAWTEVPFRKLYDPLHKLREPERVSHTCTSGNRQTLVLSTEPAVAFEGAPALLSCGSGARENTVLGNYPWTN